MGGGGGGRQRWFLTSVVVQCSVVLECCYERVRGCWADGDCPCPVDA